MSTAENGRPADVGRGKEPAFKKKWLYTLLLFLAAALTGLLHIEHLLNGMTKYSFSFFGFLGCWGDPVVFLSVPVLMLICLILLVVRVGRRCGTWKLDIAASVVLVPLILWGYTRPGYTATTYGFRERMKRTADIPAIRSWLEETEFKPEQMGWRGLDPSDWPECIKKLEPQYVKLQDESCARIVWGGGFGYWGVVVGPETMETPPSDIREYGEYRLQLCPGAYVWRELQ